MDEPALPEDVDMSDATMKRYILYILLAVLSRLIFPYF